MTATPQMLVTDLDGTLVHGRRVAAADVEALLRWREAGNLLTIATGRSVMLARLALQDAQAAAGAPLGYDYVICASGTTLLDPQGRVLRCRPVLAEQVRAVGERLIGRADLAVIATTLEGDFLLHNPFAEADDFSRYASLFTLASLEEVLAHEVTSMPVRIPDDATADALAQELVAASGGLIGAPRSVQYLDVVPAGEDKGAAVTHLRGLLAEAGTQVSRVIAAGDSWNDIPMFAVADLACAMETGTADARQAAVDAGGVVRASLAELVDSLMEA